MANINSENLSSIIFFSYNGYATGVEQATALAERNYGAYIQGLGTLSKTTSGDSYWDNYRNIIYKDTEHKYTKLKEIYNEGLTYMTTFIEPENNVSIENGRYTSRYSYQVDLENDFSNAESVTFNDLKNFLCSLNWQTFNKQKMYNGENEINSIRIGVKTFYWHNEGDLSYSYSYISLESATYSYSYQYVDENNETQTYSYSYEYYPTIVENHYFDADNYYAYIRKEYVPIDDTLHESIQSYLTSFENAHGNNTDIYTYYMNECNVVIPMTIDSRSIGVKKSTLLCKYNSTYDGMFYDTINFNVNLSTEENEKVVLAKITSNRDGAVFTVKKNQYESIGSNDVIIDEDENKSIMFNGEIEDTISLTAPFDMKELSLKDVSNAISGELNLNATNWTSKGNHLKSLIIGTDSATSEITKVTGINDFTNLEYVSIKGLNDLTNTPAISNLGKLNIFDASYSNITAFKPKASSYIYEAKLPETIKAIKLDNVTFESGVSKVFDEQVYHFGNLDYEPTANLQSFSATNSTSGIDTYEFVSKWIETLKAEDKLKLSSLIYLELQNINWKNVPANMLYDLKQFDLGIKEDRYGLAGEISIEGSGNYGLLTIEEYSKLLRLYGRKAFSTSASKEKVFESLMLYMKNDTLEPYEFYLKVSNSSLEENADANIVLDAKLNFDSPKTAKPTAAISFLDILKTTNNELTFTVDNHEKYAYCKLNTTIDTTDSEEATPQLGDIMLFNGDTILIFFNEVSDTLNSYKYVKIGHITDKEHMNTQYGYEYREPSTIKVWVKDNTFTLKFESIEKPNVISKITLKPENDRTFILPEHDTLKTLDVLMTVDKEVEDSEIEVVIPENFPIEYTEEATSDPKVTKLIFTRKEDSELYNLIGHIVVRSKKADSYVTSLGLTPENLVNASIDIIIAKGAEYSSENNKITLNQYLYEIHDGVVVADKNAVEINGTTLILN